MSQITLVLTGPYAGQNITLRDIKFTDGKAVIPGTVAQHEGLIRYMQTSFQAYLEGSSELAALTGQKQEEKKEEKEEDKDPTPEIDEKLLAAVMGLDPMNDAHWTQKGFPSIEAVQEILGSKEVTAKKIKAVAPDYTRDAALARAAAAAQ